MIIINITKLLSLYTHCTFYSFIAKKCEVSMCMVWPKLSVYCIIKQLYNHGEWFQQVSLHVEALLEWLNCCMLSHAHLIIVHMHRVGTIRGWVYTLAKESVQEQFKGRENSRKHSNLIPQYITPLFLSKKPSIWNVYSDVGTIRCLSSF